MPLAILFVVGIAPRLATALQLRRGHPLLAWASQRWRSLLPWRLRDFGQGGSSTDSSPIISLRLAPPSAGQARPDRDGAGSPPRLLERAPCPTSPPPSTLWSPRGKRLSRRYFSRRARGRFAANCAARCRAPQRLARGPALVGSALAARSRGGRRAKELLASLRAEFTRTLENASNAIQGAVAAARTRRASPRSRRRGPREGAR